MTREWQYITAVKRFITLGPGKLVLLAPIEQLQGEVQLEKSCVVLTMQKAPS
jgi:hypothetical protein